jgi:hypothetical protein
MIRIKRSSDEGSHDGKLHACAEVLTEGTAAGWRSGVVPEKRHAKWAEAPCNLAGLAVAGRPAGLSHRIGVASDQGQ